MPQSFYDRSELLRALRPEERKLLEAEKPQTLGDAIVIAVRILAKGSAA